MRSSTYSADEGAVLRDLPTTYADRQPCDHAAFATAFGTTPGSADARQ